MIYQRAFNLPAKWAGHRVELDLGQAIAVAPHRLDLATRNTGYIAFADVPVKDAAEVWLNGRRVGALFCPPYRVDLSQCVQPGENVLELRVYNRLINLLAQGTLHDFTPLHEAVGCRFDMIQDFDALHAQPAGLTGPASLRILGQP